MDGVIPAGGGVGWLKVWKGTNQLRESVPWGEWEKRCCYMGSVDPQLLQVPTRGIGERGC